MAKIPPSTLKPSPTALGLDFGSRYVKLVYDAGPGRLERRRLDSLEFYRNYLSRQGVSPPGHGADSAPGRLSLDWERLSLAPPAYLVVTGYGKELLKAHFTTITEMRANFLGAAHQTGLRHFILLEMGGQDTKVMYIKDARVFDFLTNDRCAAGTGRYLENMARFLKLPLSRFASAWDDPVDICQTCAIFGETELISHLLQGTPLPRLAAGVNASVARRALAMTRRYPCHDLVFVGGVAKNRAVCHFLRTWGAYRVVTPPYPQFTGALGCYLEARKFLLNQHDTSSR